MNQTGGWSATILVRTSDLGAAARMLSALGPELRLGGRRGRVRLDRPAARTVRLQIGAPDTGALRASVRSYLGWIEVIQATERSIAPGKASSTPAVGEALMRKAGSHPPWPSLPSSRTI